MAAPPRSSDTPILRLLRRLGSLGTFAVVLLLGAGSAWATPITNFVISEIMYEPIGGDNGRQWIELYNGTGSSIDLANYEIQWGRNGLTDSVTLSGVLSAGSTWVIGGPTSDANNGNPTYDQVFDFNPNLGDGSHFWQEDAIALVETATSTVMHIVAYGGNGIFVPYVDEQGLPAVAIDDSALAPGQSLEFLGGDTWQVQATASPGTPNAVLTPVPEQTPAALLGLGLILLAALRKSRLMEGLFAHGHSGARIRA